MSAEQKQRHLGVSSDQVGKYVLMPGDPGRCEPIAAFLDGAVHVATNREFSTWTGTLDGTTVSVVSTGVGSPSAAIAVEELHKIGAHTFIRVGTSGAMQPDIVHGELAIVTGAIRDEGTSRQYLPIEFPAVADGAVVAALTSAARQANLPHRLGISHSKDSFYGETETARMPLAGTLAERWNAWVAGGAICSEMESSAIFILSSIYGTRAGGIMQMHAGGAPGNQNALLSTAIGAVRLLIARDRADSALEGHSA
ncbi:nucleoside phosphorylase [Rathayibacter soli]|uniref:nucleoside phosphorylase n=1 Tax=Rathayibacter soli TaxID=3144168 RepID=UPI0027E53A43|nr:nucleoside phosphorylase [Glaciibacter superstes]